MSWSVTADAYDVFFNRDERHGRGPETPPQISRADDCTYLAPRDTDHGGTWLVVNDAGLTVCVLNDYGCTWQPAPAVPRLSRGLVLLGCASAGDLAGVDARLRGQDLARVAAFHLIGLAPSSAPRLWHWDGDRLQSGFAPASPAAFSSSSFDTAAVVASRLARLARHAKDPASPTPAELASYHRCYDTAAGAFSVLMRRTDAATRSICHVRVDATSAAMDYERVIWPRDPVAGPGFELSVSALSLRPGEYSRRADGLTAETTS